MGPERVWTAQVQKRLLETQGTRPTKRPRGPGAIDATVFGDLSEKTPVKNCGIEGRYERGAPGLTTRNKKLVATNVTN